MDASSISARIIGWINLHFIRHFSRYLQALGVMPFLLGPLVMGTGATEAEFLEALKRYVTFLLLFAAWEALLHLVIRVRIKKESIDYLNWRSTEEFKLAQQSTSKKKRAAATPPPIIELKIPKTQVFAMAVAVGVIVFALQALYVYFHQIVFLFILAIFTFSVLGKYLSRVSPESDTRYLLSLSPQFLYLTGIGFLSCLAVRGSAFHQPLVLAAGFAAMILAPRIIGYLNLLPHKTFTGHELAERRYLLRAHALLLVFGPISVALLVYTQQLETRYLAVFLSFLFGTRALQAVPRQAKDPIPTQVQHLTLLTSLTFIVVFIVLTIL